MPSFCHSKLNRRTSMRKPIFCWRILTRIWVSKNCLDCVLSLAIFYLANWKPIQMERVDVLPMFSLKQKEKHQQPLNSWMDKRWKARRLKCSSIRRKTRETTCNRSITTSSSRTSLKALLNSLCLTCSESSENWNQFPFRNKKMETWETLATFASRSLKMQKKPKKLSIKRRSVKVSSSLWISSLVREKMNLLVIPKSVLFLRTWQRHSTLMSSSNSFLLMWVKKSWGRLLEKQEASSPSRLRTQCRLSRISNTVLINMATFCMRRWKKHNKLSRDSITQVSLEGDLWRWNCGSPRERLTRRRNRERIERWTHSWMLCWSKIDIQLIHLNRGIEQTNQQQ